MFNMTDAKPVNVSLKGHFKVSKGQTLTTEVRRLSCPEVPYASAVGSQIYAMVYKTTRDQTLLKQ